MGKGSRSILATIESVLKSVVNEHVIAYIKKYLGRIGLVVLIVLVGGWQIWINRQHVAAIPGIHQLIERLTQTAIPVNKEPKFTIAVSLIDNDQSRETRQLIIDELKQFQGISLLLPERTISENTRNVAEDTRAGHKRARELLAKMNADAIIWGEVVRFQGKVRPRLYWTVAIKAPLDKLATMIKISMQGFSKEAPVDANEFAKAVTKLNDEKLLEQQSKRYEIESMTLSESFKDDFEKVILLIVKSYETDLQTLLGDDTRAKLDDLDEKLNRLLAKEMPWDVTTRASLQYSHATALLAKAQWDDDLLYDPLLDPNYVAQQSLQGYDPKQQGEEWVKVKLLMARILYTKGSISRSNERLHNALAILAEAQTVLHANSSYLLAQIHSHRGDIFTALGAREAGTSHLNEAIAAYHEALKEFTRFFSLEWAGMQVGRGTALMFVGVRENGTTNLEKAVMDFREALEAFPRDDMPLFWAAVKVKLGEALMSVGERETGSSRLEEAVESIREGLEKLHRDQLPFTWAESKVLYGKALMTLGQRKNDAALLKLAIVNIREGESGIRRGYRPLLWGGAKNMLGRALIVLGERENSTSHLEEAVAAFDEALTEHTAEHLPLRWAESFGNQGLALMFIAERNKNLETAQRGRQQLENAEKSARVGGDLFLADFFRRKLTRIQRISNAH